LASSICRGVFALHIEQRWVRKQVRLHIAREMSHINLFPLYKNSMPRGASCGVEVAMNKSRLRFLPLKLIDRSDASAPP